MEIIQDDILIRNNTGNKSKKSIVEGFVIRINEFDEIFQNLQETSLLNHKQHYLIIGQRGAGKTSLMHRLNYAIEDDKKLSKNVIPIVFTEEQYYLSELINLWENVAIYLDDQIGWVNVFNTIENIIANDAEFEEKAYKFLNAKLTEQKKSIILFIENINVFFHKLSNDELNRLHNILLNDSAIRLIGTSTSYHDGYINFRNPRYSFFKIIQLGGLSKEECEKLLLKIGEQYGEEIQIKNVIENHPGRIESLRRLTGGIPRTISYLFQIFLDNENGKAIKDLYILIDTLTLLYKSELDRLSTQQQKVIDIIARKWDAIAVKDIAKATRLESKNISKILSALESNQLIEKVQTDSKNHLYRIKERFMNIWYLMRFGRKHDKENVIWLVRFFDTWCEQKELTKLISAHIDNLKDGSYDVNAAIDMGNTFLSCTNVSATLKSELLRVTKSILPERLLNNVKWSRKNEHAILTNLISEERFDDAIKLLVTIDQKDLQYYKLASSLYLNTGDYVKSAEAAKKVLELDKKDANAALTLGIIYEDYIKDIDKAIEYYGLSLSQLPYHPYAASRLGDIMLRVRNDTNSAIKYHLLAVKKSFRPSLLSLGKIYLHEHEYNSAEKYLLDAQKHQVKGVYVELGNLYMQLGEHQKAKKSFELAVNNGEKDALLKFGMWYHYKQKPDLKKAEYYYNEAIDSGDIKAYGFLGKIYHRKLHDKERAFNIYTEGAIKGDSGSIHQLAHLYADKPDYKKADELFLEASEKGDKLAIICLVSNIYTRGRKDKKKFALDILETNLPNIHKDFPIELFYARILLWNGFVEKSVEVLKSTYTELAQIKTDIERNKNEFIAGQTLSALFNYFSLLLAKKEYSLTLDLFTNNNIVDFKTILKPYYFVLMELMKKEYPLEYLKAGEEFKDTIKELKQNILKIKKRIL